MALINLDLTIDGRQDQDYAGIGISKTKSAVATYRYEAGTEDIESKKVGDKTDSMRIAKVGLSWLYITKEGEVKSSFK